MRKKPQLLEIHVPNHHAQRRLYLFVAWLFGTLTVAFAWAHNPWLTVLATIVLVYAIARYGIHSMAMGWYAGRAKMMPRQP